MNFKHVNTRIDRDGWLFASLFGLISLSLAAWSSCACVVGVFTTMGVVAFFRNPRRKIPTNDNLVVSPADGVVTDISYGIIPSAEIGLSKAKHTRISIFLSVFDVHVNRTPVKGKVTSINYIKGKFLNATLDKASQHNERQAIVIQTEKKQQIAFVQIAGLIARRIRRDIELNDSLDKGAIVGIIRFGSRVDVYLPSDHKVILTVGQTAIGGETILGYTKDWPKELEFVTI